MNQNKPGGKLRKTLKWIGWFLLIQFLLINIMAALYAYKLTHFYPPGTETDSNSKNFITRTWRLFSGPKFSRMPSEQKPELYYQTLNFSTSDDEVIEGWYIPKPGKSIGTVILFHGLSINKTFLLQEAYAFYDMGYNTLLIDFRGHGNSAGATTTFGARESEEVKLAWDHIAAKGESNIILYGLSMGAVIVAKAVSDYDLRPAGVILEAPFENLRTHLRGRARILGFPSEPFATLVSFWIGIERGFNGFKLKTTEYVKEIHCPVLLQYGEEDKLVTRKEIDKIYRNIASTRKQLALHANVDHELFILKDPMKWKEEVSGFLGLR